jgi:DnaJ-class molecular chaperone
VLPVSTAPRRATCTWRSSFRPHPLYRVDGRDVYLDLPIAPWEAALGASVDVPLPDGSVQMSIPAGSGQGRKLRLKGKGIPGKTPGDLYVVLQIAMPAPTTDAQRQRLGRAGARRSPSIRVLTWRPKCNRS